MKTKYIYHFLLYSTDIHHEIVYIPPITYLKNNNYNRYIKTMNTHL